MGHQPPSEPTSNPLWAPCPPGEFHRLSKKLRARRQRRAFLQAAAVTGLVAAGAGGAWLWLRSDSEAENPGGISCSEVMLHAEDYANDKTEGCLQLQIRIHLSKCCRCKAAVDALKP